MICQSHLKPKKGLPLCEEQYRELLQVLCVDIHFFVDRMHVRESSPIFTQIFEMFNYKIGSGVSTFLLLMVNRIVGISEAIVFTGEILYCIEK